MCPERKELMLGDKPKILSLDDAGTRYEHYRELRDLFADGVEVVKTAMTYQPDNAMNKRRLESLQHAINEIDHRIEVLSGYDEHANRWSKFGRELDSIKPNVTCCCRRVPMSKIQKLRRSQARNQAPSSLSEP